MVRQLARSQIFSLTNTPFNSSDIVNGFYRLEVYKPSTSCTFTSITGSWSENILSTATLTTSNGTFAKNNRTVGGVRIKEIKDYDPISGLINSTQYLYKLYSTDSNYTSGLLVSSIQVVNNINTGSTCSVVSLSVSSNYPLGTQGGSFVVYPEVEDYRKQ